MLTSFFNISTKESPKIRGNELVFNRYEKLHLTGHRNHFLLRKNKHYQKIYDQILKSKDCDTRSDRSRIYSELGFLKLLRNV